MRTFIYGATFIELASTLLTSKTFSIFLLILCSFLTACPLHYNITQITSLQQQTNFVSYLKICGGIFSVRIFHGMECVLGLFCRALVCVCVCPLRKALCHPSPLASPFFFFLLLKRERERDVRQARERSAKSARYAATLN